MKLNPDSWFVRNYLHIPNHKALPKTLCEFIRVFCSSTFMNACIMAFVGIISGILLYGAYVWIIFLFTDLTISDIENNGNMIVSFAIIPFIAIYAMGMLVYLPIKAYISYRNTNSYKRRHAYFLEHGKYPEKTVNPITAFIKGVWARIHDKTCVIIEWDDNSKQKTDHKN